MGESLGDEEDVRRGVGALNADLAGLTTFARTGATDSLCMMRVEQLREATARLLARGANGWELGLASEKTTTAPVFVIVAVEGERVGFGFGQGDVESAEAFCERYKGKALGVLAVIEGSRGPYRAPVMASRRVALAWCSLKG